MKTAYKTIKQEDAKKCIEAYLKILDRSRGEEHYELYKDDFDLAQVNALNLSSDFMEMAKNFVGKRNTLFIAHLRKMGKLFVEDEINLTTLLINKENLVSLDLLDEAMLSLEIDLSGMTKQDLKDLQKVIQNSKKPIHNIMLLGVRDDDDVREFIEGLYNVELINVQNKKLETFANQITHRNNLVIALGVRITQKVDPWKEIIEKWSEVSPCVSDASIQPPTRLYYHKFISAWKYYGRYAIILRSLYKIASGSTEPDKEPGSTEYELYNTVNGCVTAMQDLFFTKMLENIEDNSRDKYFQEFEIDTDLSDENIKTLIDWVEKHDTLPFKTLILKVDKSAEGLQKINPLLGVLRNKSLDALVLKSSEWDDGLLVNTLNIEKLDYMIQIKLFAAGSWLESNVRFMEPRTPKFLQKMSASYSAYRSKPSPDDGQGPTIEYLEVAQDYEQIEEAAELSEKIEQEEQQKAYDQFEGDLVDLDLFNSSKYTAVRRNIAGDNISVTNQELFSNFPDGIKYISPEAAMYIAKNELSFSSFNIDPSVIPIGFKIKKKMQEEVLVLDYDRYDISQSNNVFIPKTPKYTIDYKSGQEIYEVVEEYEKNVKRTNIFNIIRNKRTVGFGLSYLCLKHGFDGLDKLCNKIGEVDDVHSGFAQFLNDKYIRNFAQLDHFLNDSDFVDSLDKIKGYDSTKYQCLQRFLENTGTSRTDLKDIIDAFEVFWKEYEILCAKEGVSLDKILNTNWSTSKIVYHNYYGRDYKYHLQQLPTPGANPVVYMYRLLSILKNARSVSEQLNNLDDIVLDNYGAYYASKYEGLKLVSKEMHFYPPNSFEDQCLKLDKAIKMALDRAAQPGNEKSLEMLKLITEKQEIGRSIKIDDIIEDTIKRIRDYIHPYRRHEYNSNTGRSIDSLLESLSDDKTIRALPEELNPVKIYNEICSQAKKEVSVYRVELEDLSESLKKGEQNFDEFVVLAYRFLGCQPHGAKVLDFKEALEAYRASTKNPDPQVILTMLLFISHSRYDGTEKLGQLLLSIGKHGASLKDINKQLLDLYKSDTKLSEKEGLYIFNVLLSNETEGPKLVSKLFELLKTNKEAALNMIVTQASANAIANSMSYANSLLENQGVAIAYGEKIHLFCALLKDADLDKVAEIGKYLSQAANTEKPNNLDTAFHLITNSREEFNIAQILKAFKEIETPLGDTTVHDVLVKHKFKIKSEMPALMTKAPSVNLNLQLRYITYALTKTINSRNVREFRYFLNGPDDYLKQKEMELEKHKNLPHTTPQDVKSYTNTLASIEAKIQELKADKKEFESEGEKTTEAMWNEINKLFSQSSFLTKILGTGFLQVVLSELRSAIINDSLNKHLQDPVLKEFLNTNLSELGGFNIVKDFEDIAKVEKESESIVPLFAEIEKSVAFQSNKVAFVEALKKLDFSKLKYNALYMVLDTFSKMPRRDYLGILDKLITSPKLIENTDTLEQLLADINTLHKAKLPSNYIKNLITLLSKYPTIPEEQARLMYNTRVIFKRDNEDKLLIFINNNIKTLSLSEVIELLEVAVNSEVTHIKQIAKLAADLHATKPPQLSQFLEKLKNSTGSQLILQIIARSNAATSAKPHNVPIDYPELITQISSLGLDDIGKLLPICETTAPNISCLTNALQRKKDESQTFDQFLERLEREPFGRRNLKEQFDISQVERVVNGSKDLINQTEYTYLYRKQWMESFLFVNAAGEKLPIYKGKAAKDLSNKEIKEFFQQIKTGQILQGFSKFQKGLYVLALMREAMYRTSGQQPNSTQVLSIIDCMMHKADVMSNIDTGQGKSLMSVMKASLLWLSDDRADITTSSLTDARRDIEGYFPYLDFLGIPNEKEPITSASAFKDFQQHGVNISTFSQLSLFFSKVLIYEGHTIKSKSASLVAEESDHSILEDQVIYRYATTHGAPVKSNEVWVYDGINSYMDKHATDADIRRPIADRHIRMLRDHLKVCAKSNSMLPTRINLFSDEQLEQWLDAAYTVRFRLRENYEYVLSPEKEEKEINGRKQQTRVARIIMKDGRISNDTQYGKGVQQLLYARQNAINHNKDFIIEPESVTIDASNNKNFIDTYRDSNGHIWGSSATVGSSMQVQEQYEDYGFEFSAIQPHHVNIVEKHEIKYTENSQDHLAAIIRALIERHDSGNDRPALVVCKDIETANKLHNLIQKQEKLNKNLQLFMGSDSGSSKKERDVIQAAGNEGTITIATRAFGRNTDIKTKKGLDAKVSPDLFILYIINKS